MSVTVLLPPILRPLSGGEQAMPAEGASVLDAMRDLCRTHPQFALHLFDERGAIRRNIVFLHDGVLIRAHEAAAHAIRDGDEIVLANALVGG